MLSHISAQCHRAVSPCAPPPVQSQDINKEDFNTVMSLLFIGPTIKDLQDKNYEGSCFVLLNIPVVSTELLASDFLCNRHVFHVGTWYRRFVFGKVAADHIIFWSSLSGYWNATSWALAEEGQCSCEIKCSSDEPELSQVCCDMQRQPLMLKLLGFILKFLGEDREGLGQEESPGAIRNRYCIMTMMIIIYS